MEHIRLVAQQITAGLWKRRRRRKRLKYFVKGLGFSYNGDFIFDLDTQSFALVTLSYGGLFLLFSWPWNVDEVVHDQKLHLRNGAVWLLFRGLFGL